MKETPRIRRLATGASCPLHRSMGFFLRHLELFLTAAGLVVIFGVTALFHPADTSPWTVATVTAVAVGVLHGFLFWLVRQRQRDVRRRALAETERMLRDVIINQLAVIRLTVDMQTHPPVPASLDRIERAITVINHTLNGLSEESLTRWQERYHGSAPKS